MSFALRGHARADEADRVRPLGKAYHQKDLIACMAYDEFTLLALGVRAIIEDASERISEDGKRTLERDSMAPQV
jgi:hypothetical protein